MPGRGMCALREYCGTVIDLWLRSDGGLANAGTTNSSSHSSSSTISSAKALWYRSDT